jgi:AcrR family transcriptional regulator
MARSKEESDDSRVRKGQETKLQLLASARSLFAEHGFSGTRFDSIGKDLGKTSGVMYHHFRDKRELFKEVVRQCHSEISQRVVASAETERDILEGILRGCLTFIAEVISPEYFRIMLIDSISVLGWEAWKELDSEFSERAMTIGLREAQDAGLLAQEIPAAALARFLSGGTNELALWVHHQTNRLSAVKQAETVLRHLLATLRKGSGLQVKSRAKSIGRKP